jgi:hypothetical protein
MKLSEWSASINKIDQFQFNELSEIVTETNILVGSNLQMKILVTISFANQENLCYISVGNYKKSQIQFHLHMKKDLSCSPTCNLIKSRVATLLATEKILVTVSLVTRKKISCNPLATTKNISLTILFATGNKYLSCNLTYNCKKNLSCNPSCNWKKKFSVATPPATIKKILNYNPSCNWKKYQLQPVISQD